MPPPPVVVVAKGPGLKDLARDIERISKSEVLVGIPEEGNARMSKAEAIKRLVALGARTHGGRLKRITPARIKKEMRLFNSRSDMNNARLLWLHARGSPLNGTPPRPVLEPSVERNMGEIGPHLDAAVEHLLNNGPISAERELHQAGKIAANAAQGYVMAGSNLAPNAPSVIERKHGDRPLIETGSMVAAITHVVRVGS
jgi:hypothetical protein